MTLVAHRVKSVACTVPALTLAQNYPQAAPLLFWLDRLSEWPLHQIFWVKFMQKYKTFKQQFMFYDVWQEEQTTDKVGVVSGLREVFI